MATVQQPAARERHFREMAVWHDWPEDGEAQVGRPSMRINVANPERVASVIGGGALAAYGISRRTWPGYALAALGGTILVRGLTGHCNAYRALKINSARRGRAEPIDFYENGIQVTKAVTINESPRTLYSFWRDFTNLPHVMSHLESVEIIDDLSSHWVAKGPMDSRVEWDAEIINDEPYELIAWRSLPGAAVDNAGSVRFVRAPGGRGTQVRVNIEYIPTAGRLSAAFAKLFGEEPNQQVQEDLRHLKQIFETGEMPTTQGQPRGQCKGRSSHGDGRARHMRSMTPRRGFTGRSSRSIAGGSPRPDSTPIVPPESES